MLLKSTKPVSRVLLPFGDASAFPGGCPEQRQVVPDIAWCGQANFRSGKATIFESAPASSWLAAAVRDHDLDLRIGIENALVDDGEQAHPVTHSQRCIQPILKLTPMLGVPALNPAMTTAPWQSDGRIGHGPPAPRK